MLLTLYHIVSSALVSPPSSVLWSLDNCFHEDETMYGDSYVSFPFFSNSSSCLSHQVPRSPLLEISGEAFLDSEHIGPLAACETHLLLFHLDATWLDTTSGHQSNRWLVPSPPTSPATCQSHYYHLVNTGKWWVVLYSHCFHGFKTSDSFIVRWASASASLFLASRNLVQLAE